MYDINSLILAQYFDKFQSQKLVNKPNYEILTT